MLIVFLKLTLGVQEESPGFGQVLTLLAPEVGVGQELLGDDQGRLVGPSAAADGRSSRRDPWLLLEELVVQDQGRKPWAKSSNFQEQYKTMTTKA
jgi:hypothetical protein